jgi:hypothetical protein
VWVGFSLPGRAGYQGCADCWLSRRRFKGECNGITGTDHLKVGTWRERSSGHAAGSGSTAASIRATAIINRKQFEMMDPFVQVIIPNRIRSLSVQIIHAIR